MQVQLRILRYDPERDPQAALGGVHGRGRARRDRVLDLLHTVKWRPGRLADLPALLRPRGVRLGRDAHQRPQPPGLQDPGRPAGHARSPSRRCPACRSSRTWSSTWRLLRQVPERHAIPGERRRAARDASGSSRPRSGRATTTPPSASCAPLHHVLPAVLGAARLRRPGGDRQRAPVHLRHAATRARTSGWRSSPTRTASGAAAPSSTARTPARATSRSPRPSSRSRPPSWSAGSEPDLRRASRYDRRRGPPQALRAAGHPHRRRLARQPRAGVRRSRAHRRLKAGCLRAGRDGGRGRGTRTSASGRTTSPSTRGSCWRCARPSGWAPRRSTCVSIRSSSWSS